MKAFAMNSSPLSVTQHEHASIGIQPTVLLAGQNRVLCSQLSNRLQALYQISIVESFHETHSKVVRDMPDVLVIDFTMNSAHALQLCYAIKLDKRINHIPILLVADSVDMNTRLAGLQFGADDCITGTGFQEELVWRIRNLVQLCKNLRRYNEQMNKETERTNEPSPLSSSYLVYKIMRVVEDNLADPEFNVHQFATALGLSSIQLYRKMVKLFDMTPNDYIRKIRLQRAAQLLHLHSGNVYEVAYRVGYTNLSYFSKSFRQFHACSPREFIRKFQSGNLNCLTIQ
jgi:AraC-like DNA-binding protein